MNTKSNRRMVSAIMLLLVSLLAFEGQAYSEKIVVK